MFEYIVVQASVLCFSPITDHWSIDRSHDRNNDLAGTLEANSHAGHKSAANDFISNWGMSKVASAVGLPALQFSGNRAYEFYNILIKNK